MIRLQSDEPQQLLHPNVGILAVRDVVDLERFADDRADRHARVQRCIRVLKDDLHLLAERAQIVVGQSDELPALERDAAFGRFGKPQDDAAGGRLARARLSDEPECLAAANLEVDAVDGAHVRDVPLQNAGRDRKELVEIANDDQIVVGRPGRGGPVERGGHFAVTAICTTAEPGMAGRFSASIGF